jgi:hypothetical protein
VDHEKFMQSQNSGVMTEGTHHMKPIDFYGVLKEVIELLYPQIMKFVGWWLYFDAIGTTNKARLWAFEMTNFSNPSM